MRRKHSLGRHAISLPKMDRGKSIASFFRNYFCTFQVALKLLSSGLAVFFALSLLFDSNQTVEYFSERVKKIL
jgi:hypothetical protein